MKVKYKQSRKDQIEGSRKLTCYDRKFPSSKLRRFVPKPFFTFECPLLLSFSPISLLLQLQLSNKIELPTVIPRRESPCLIEIRMRSWPTTSWRIESSPYLEVVERIRMQGKMGW
ncbi:hypothetical protein COLO4_34369 [Corchorus olitorius]|uniref:Uncharacterized protein n=1 Tax=Corchorus olitorius TaxID=93759 RepID=A0A1R3GL71_9ROSI|nr:hypothetical protein COLO4_34369 [Corchorus olitorius]